MMLDPAHSQLQAAASREALYLRRRNGAAGWTRAAGAFLRPVATPEGDGKGALDCGARAGTRLRAGARSSPKSMCLRPPPSISSALRGARQGVVVAAWSDGSRERLGHVLAEHGLPDAAVRRRLAAGALALGKAPFRSPCSASSTVSRPTSLAVVGEQDILGDRLVRRRRKAKRAENLLGEIAALSAGDLVVHVDHGIGRFIGLETITAAGAPHDCLEIHYAGGDKLYLPVENIELLSRYGSEDTEVQLDRLGGAGWQSRKARMKKRIREMAKGLIAIAAQRMLRQAPKLAPPEGLYDEFCARFPYDETEDQAARDRRACSTISPRAGRWTVSSAATSASARPKSRCAPPSARRSTASRSPSSCRRRCWRASTTRLSRSASRACRSASGGCRAWSAPAEARETKKRLAEGSVDILIGTHAVLGKGVDLQGSRPRRHRRGAAFRRRPQGAPEGAARRGACADAVGDADSAHAATRDDRRARTLADRDAAGRPARRAQLRLALRSADRARGAAARALIAAARRFSSARASRISTRPRPSCAKTCRRRNSSIAHGQMAPTELEEKMSAFYDGKYDILLSTSIVESGLDIPNANTLIVWRADMFGLGAALSIARARRTRQDARLCAVHDAREPHDHAAGAKAARGAAIARHARRRLPAREPRSRHPRRRQSARRRAVRPYQGSRLRALSADADRRRSRC